MESLILGFLTGGSLILVIGPQNLFVIEQGLKKNFVFTITTICTVSDILLIFLGVFIYQSFEVITNELILLFRLYGFVAIIDHKKFQGDFGTIAIFPSKSIHENTPSFSETCVTDSEDISRIVPHLFSSL